MEERSTAPAGTPRYKPEVAKARVDRMPTTPDEWSAFGQLPATERSAVYLRSIRTMLTFFTVLTILGIVAGVVLALVGIHAVHQSSTTTNPFG